MAASAGATPFPIITVSRLDKFQQEDIDRCCPAMRVDITGVLGNAQEIAWSNPAAPISDFTMASSERCRVSATLVPAPGLAE
jgi:hypothetical protein